MVSLALHHAIFETWS